MSNAADGNFDSKYGTIHMSHPGPKNDPPYESVNIYRRPEGDVHLQGPALRAFKAAEVRATPRRQRRKGRVQAILITGVGYRSWQSQYSYYHSDPPGSFQRYANPDESMHVEALAVDLDMSVGFLRRVKVTRALKAEGFHFSVEGEPWHGSFRLEG